MARAQSIVRERCIIGATGGAVAAAESVRRNGGPDVLLDSDPADG
jgi:hypothetical protein